MSVPQLLAALATKLAGFGMAAKAGLGVAVAAASVTTAGAAGVLPAPVQEAVADVVRVATPFELPDPTKVADDLTRRPPDVDDPLSGPGDGVDLDEGVDDGVRATNHGACVSAVARQNVKAGPPNAHGKAVSAVARSDCGKESVTPGTTPTTLPDDTTTTTVDTTTTTLERGVESSGGHGRGGGNANVHNGNRGPGSGHSGPGNAGRGNSGPGNSGNRK